jgi:hypothetical protein
MRTTSVARSGNSTSRGLDDTINEGRIVNWLKHSDRRLMVKSPRIVLQSANNTYTQHTSAMSSCRSPTDRDIEGQKAMPEAIPAASVKHEPQH